MSICPRDCLMPALLDQFHLVIEVRVGLGAGDQRGGQLYPVAAGAHDPHRRYRPRTPTARGTPTPGADIGHRHISNMVMADRLDVRDGLPGHELAPEAVDLDSPGRQPGADVSAPGADSEAARRVGEREDGQPLQSGHVEPCREQGRGNDQPEASLGQWPGAVAAAEAERDIVHDANYLTIGDTLERRSLCTPPV